MKEWRKVRSVNNRVRMVWVKLAASGQLEVISRIGSDPAVRVKGKQEDAKQLAAELVKATGIDDADVTAMVIAAK